MNHYIEKHKKSKGIIIIEFSEKLIIRLLNSKIIVKNIY